jgi:hypothetical protein
MCSPWFKRISLFLIALTAFVQTGESQNFFKLKYKKSSVYAGIEVGAKGVKMSVLEIGKNAQQTGAYNVLKDTSINTDFISFTSPTATATLNGLYKLYNNITQDYKVSPERVFTLISSGVKSQADKEGKADWIKSLIDSFRIKVNEPARSVYVIDVLEEARLSHLGIIPAERRFNTFLIDIGSGNSKGGYFPNDNTKDFKLFQLSWGTKSMQNAAEKRCGEDKSISNFQKQLYRVLAGSPSDEITYAVNVSNAYAMSDNIAISGGIAWSIANLLYPELAANPVVPVTYDEVLKLSEKMYRNFSALSDDAIVRTITDKAIDKVIAAREIRKVLGVFDQKALMAGTGLLLKIMRQFENQADKKQFFLVKNGQVGWISAYVDQYLPK